MGERGCCWGVLCTFFLVFMVVFKAQPKQAKNAF